MELQNQKLEKAIEKFEEQFEVDIRENKYTDTVDDRIHIIFTTSKDSKIKLETGSIYKDFYIPLELTFDFAYTPKKETDEIDCKVFICCNGRDVMQGENYLYAFYNQKNKKWDQLKWAT